MEDNIEKPGRTIRNQNQQGDNIRSRRKSRRIFEDNEDQ